ncbi:MAG: hypothetical protein ABI417_21760 [Coleofasciculaceae cyanobacterium]
MAKKPLLHPYADRLTFERLLLLIATLVQYPGVGCCDSLAAETQKHHNALDAVQAKLRQVAAAMKIELQKDTRLHRQFAKTCKPCGIMAFSTGGCIAGVII